MSFLFDVLPAAASLEAGTTFIGLGEGAELVSSALPITQVAYGAGAAAGGIPWGTLLTGVSAGSQLLKGMAGYQSGRQNASYLNQAADQALAAGAANKDIVDRKNRAALGELKAGVGAQGTTMEGSPLLVYLSSVTNAAIEGQNEYYQGSLKSQGLRQQAKISKSDATSSLWEGIVKGAGTLAAGSLGSKLALA
jgi:hypothetical protein